MAARPHPYLARCFAAWLLSTLSQWVAAVALLVRLLGYPDVAGPWEFGLAVFLIVNLVPQFLWKIEAKTYLYLRMQPTPEPRKD